MGNTNLPKFIIEYSQNGQHFKKAIAATNRERACEIAFAYLMKAPSTIYLEPS